MEIKTLLSRLPFVEGHKSITNGIDHNTPYHTFTYEGVKVHGLRENEKRIKLFTDIVGTHAGFSINGVLDIGCNLGTISHGINAVCWGAQPLGIDEDPAILELARVVYPNSNFICRSMNAISLQEVVSRKHDVVLCLSMFEYIKEKERFLDDVCHTTGRICIIEGHSMDLLNGNADRYEALIRAQPWHVARVPELTDGGTNAPLESPGRPVWVCLKGG